MSTDLKPGWRRLRFDQMAINSTERIDNPAEAGVEHYVGLEHLDGDSLRIRRWGVPTDVEATKLRFYSGDIIFGKRRVYQRKLAVAEFDGICSAHAMVLRARPEVVLPIFLPYFMQSDLFMNRALEISVGSLSPTINWTALARQEFDLPPLDEQRRIAEVLGASTTLIASLQEMQVAANLAWNSTSAALFASSSIADRDVELLGLGECVVYASDGPFGSKLKTEHYNTDGVRVVRLQNIQREQFDNSDSAFIREDYYLRELTRYTVKPGDVLIAGLGDDRIPAGRACLAPQDLGVAVNKADCYCLRTNQKVSPAYLVAFLNSAEGMRQSASMSQGTTRYRLNLSNIKRMKIPVKSESRQRQVVEVLSACQDSINRIDDRLFKSRQQQRLLSSMLLDQT